MTIFSSVPNFPKEQQRLGALKLGQSTVSGIELNFQEAPSSSKLLKELKPKTVAHFFESPSKYISLKAFNGQNQEQYSDGLESLKSDQISKSTLFILTFFCSLVQRRNKIQDHQELVQGIVHRRKECRPYNHW